jgi:PKD repeat protein
MGLVAPRLVFVPLIAGFFLAFGGGTAHAVTYDFTVDPPVPNQGEPTAFQLTPTAAALDRVRWDLDGDGDYDDGATRTVKRSYANAGPVTVGMRARETSHDDWQTVTKTVTVNAAPAADFGYSPSAPLAGEEVAFTPEVADPEGNSVTLEWSFGDGESSATGAPTHSFAAAGTYDVVLTATDEHGAATQVTHQVTVAEDPGPAPAFGYTPADPMTGDTVTFTSTSTPSQGSITATDWDFDGDGQYDASGSEVAWVFDAAGVHQVTMRVTQSNGRQAVAFGDVQVAERPPPPPGDGDPGGGDTGGGDPGGSPAVTDPGPADPGGGATVTTPTPKPKPKPPALMRPFPVVRIAGVVLPSGALVKVLSVRAARGTRVVARCRGRGCPVGAVARSSATSLVRFHRFERRLRAGVRLELFVRKAGRIGKYTRFLIRAGKPPARVDRCLMPGRDRPVRCP